MGRNWAIHWALLCMSAFVGCGGGGGADNDGSDGGIAVPGTSKPVVTSVGPVGELGSSGTSVTFAATVTGTASSYSWDFGGGTTPNGSTAISPTVTLGAEGDYTGTVIATNPSGTSAVYAFDYSVAAQPSSPGLPQPIEGQLYIVGDSGTGLFATYLDKGDNLLNFYAPLTDGVAEWGRVDRIEAFLGTATPEGAPVAILSFDEQGLPLEFSWTATGDRVSFGFDEADNTLGVTYRTGDGTLVGRRLIILPEGFRDGALAVPDDRAFDDSDRTATSLEPGPNGPFVRGALSVNGCELGLADYELSLSATYQAIHPILGVAIPFGVTQQLSLTPTETMGEYEYQLPIAPVGGESQIPADLICATLADFGGTLCSVIQALATGGTLTVLKEALLEEIEGRLESFLAAILGETVGSIHDLVAAIEGGVCGIVSTIVEEGICPAFPSGFELYDLTLDRRIELSVTGELSSPLPGVSDQSSTTLYLRADELDSAMAPSLYLNLAAPTGCIESITPSGRIGRVGDTVGFDALTKGPVDSWAWSFAEGTVSPPNSASASPVVKLENVGLFEGTLKVGSGGITPTSYSKSFTYEILEPLVISTVAPDGTVGKVGEAVTFSAVVTGAIDQEAVLYSWNFGAGAFPASSTVATPTVTLASPGIYSGSLVVREGEHSSAPFAFQFQVNSSIPEILDVFPGGLVGKVGEFVEFGATVEGQIEGWQWRMGGGAIPEYPANSPNAIVELSSSGTFSGELMVWNQFGASTPFAFTYEVGPKDPDPVIIHEIFGPENLFECDETDLNFSYSGDLDELLWELGGGLVFVDGYTSQHWAPRVKGSNPGTYSGSLTLSNSLGSVTRPFSYEVLEYGGACSLGPWRATSGYSYSGTWQTEIVKYGFDESGSFQWSGTAEGDLTAGVYFNVVDGVCTVPILHLEGEPVSVTLGCSGGPCPEPSITFDFIPTPDELFVDPGVEGSYPTYTMTQDFCWNPLNWFYYKDDLWTIHAGSPSSVMIDVQFNESKCPILTEGCNCSDLPNARTSAVGQINLTLSEEYDWCQ